MDLSVPKDCDYMLYIIVAIVAAMVGYFLYTYKKDNGSSPKEKGVSEKKVTFGNDGPITMYGKDSCPWCKRQKTELGSEWEKVNYVNCKDSPEKCKEGRIAALPTWVINGERTEGFMKKEEFVKKCGA